MTTIEEGMLVRHRENEIVGRVERVWYGEPGKLVASIQPDNRPAFIDYADLFEPALVDMEVELMLKLHRDEEVRWGAAVGAMWEHLAGLGLMAPVAECKVELTEKGHEYAEFESMRASMQKGADHAG
jgi:hypothetical protein